ncbi:hypothetical protein JXB01_01805 [Candidatus Micrarchaeota archaeon]|nr:hypothetical protein [Candidatus Micrarchaeota archaeon]
MELVEGKKITAEGLITRSRNSRGEYIYGFTDGETIVDVVARRLIEVGKIVEVTGTVENFYGFSRIKAESIEELENQKEKYKEIEKRAEENSKIKDVELMCSDEMMKKLKPKMAETAKKLLAAQKLGRFTIVRFHGDGDGIAGALAMTYFVKGKYFQQNSAVYSVGDAMKDLQMCSNQNHPLMVFIDFGSGEESREGLSLLKAGGIELLIVDHHPNYKKIDEYCSISVNPWQVEYSEGSSKYTAGYLASEISRTAGNDSGDMAKTALASDKSTIIEIEEEYKNKAIVLNYVAAYSGYGNSLEFYADVLANKELYSSILEQAKEKISQIVEISRNRIKKQKAGEINFYYINLEDIVKRYEFPSYGKSTTQIFEAVESGEPLVLVGYGKRSVMLRINDSAVLKGADTRKIIEKLKETMEDFVGGGGGHSRAAAIRVKEGFEKSVVEEILRMLQNEQEK